MNLSTPVSFVPRVGPQYQKRLKRMGIKTIGDLFFHFPHRYEDFSNIIPIARAGETEGTFCVQGKILEIKNIRTWKRRLTLTQALVGDETGTVKVIWFNQPDLINTFKKDDFLCLAGKMSSKKAGRYLSSPAYEKISNNFFENSGDKKDLIKPDLVHTGRLIPVYPETEGLSSKWLRFIIKPLLTKLKGEIPESLPEKIVKEKDFLPIQKAIWQIHFPDSIELAQKSKKRFAFEELFIISLLVLRERMKLAKENAIPVSIKLDWVKKFVDGLPFKLTPDQKKSAWQILKDMEKSRPMNRLLEGDVGSGKTMVAIIAALNTAKAGCQTALMAPTEILAKQHFKTIGSFLKNFNLNIGLITGKESQLNDEKITRKEFLEKAVNGEADILIGTHALIQNEKSSKISGVKFNRLALVIVDEQHRFGVEQRASLCQSDNGKTNLLPHFLSMTATPIPRTLSLTIYGDLDLSLITHLPKGRKKIITRIIAPGDREKAYQFVRREVKKDRQVFVICPRIEPKNEFPEGEVLETDLFKSQRQLLWLEVKAVKAEYEKLSKKIFPDLKVGMLHGKMKTLEKEEIMRKFKEGKINVLVSTSVVEVGIDIPNATLMMIEGAEKFGLAQLHQFRGRVGRSKYQSFCFLLTDLPGQKTNARLRALVNCENGFELAEKDLAIRGPGDFVGQRQWGIPDIAMASLKDLSFVQESRRLAKEILEEDPELKKYPLLRERLKEFRERIHLE